MVDVQFAKPRVYYQKQIPSKLTSFELSSACLSHIDVVVDNNFEKAVGKNPDGSQKYA